jgi:MSHA biogenesis protein MshK
MDRGLSNMGVYKTILILLCLYSANSIATSELPDPTRPPSFIDRIEEPVFYEEVDVKQVYKWKVSVIRISADDRSAIVNGKLVREGDTVGPAKLLEITPLSVVLDHEERRLIVRLYNNQVIKNYKSNADVKRSNNQSEIN